MIKRIYRYTKSQHEDAIKLDGPTSRWLLSARLRRPWKVTRWKRRNPLVLLPA